MFDLQPEKRGNLSHCKSSSCDFSKQRKKVRNKTKNIYKQIAIIDFNLDAVTLAFFKRAKNKEMKLINYFEIGFLSLSLVDIVAGCCCIDCTIPIFLLTDFYVSFGFVLFR